MVTIRKQLPTICNCTTRPLAESWTDRRRKIKNKDLTPRRGDTQLERLRRTWPDGDPFYPYEKMERYLGPLLVEDPNWHHYSGNYLYFTVYGDDIEGTLADAMKVFEERLGMLERKKP